MGKHGGQERCSVICSGLSSQNRYQHFNTWSKQPFLKIPQSEDDLKEFLHDLSVDALLSGGEIGDKYVFLIKALCYGSSIYEEPNIEGNVMSCCFCQMICGPDLKENKRNYQKLINAGLTNQK